MQYTVQLQLMLQITDWRIENLISYKERQQNRYKQKERRNEGPYLKKLVKERNETGIACNMWEKKC